MNSIVYIGIDVHKESYTLCCFRPEDDAAKHTVKIKSDYKQVLNYIDKMRSYYGEETEFFCGYEAGPLGYKLYHQLTERNIGCAIMAPTSMGVTNTNRIKHDRGDAANIAKCLAFRLYSPVHVPTQQDEQVKEYLRMRDDQKEALKKVKQQILAFVLRQDNKYDLGRSNWTIAHLKWLKALKFDGLLQEAFEEYMITYDYLVNKIDRITVRIEEIAEQERYADKVSRLTCLIGVKTYTALSVIVETGDFNRFAKAEQYASYLGLVPSEESSGSTQRKGGITKAGNSQIRRMLVESAQSYTRGAIGHKSKELNRRQNGNELSVISYADKANERLRRKFYRMVLNNGTPRNKAATAIARELACFMWGLMTDNIS
jgi:transposase